MGQLLNMQNSEFFCVHCLLVLKNEQKIELQDMSHTTNVITYKLEFHNNKKTLHTFWN